MLLLVFDIIDIWLSILLTETITLLISFIIGRKAKSKISAMKL